MKNITFTAFLLILSMVVNAQVAKLGKTIVTDNRTLLDAKNELSEDLIYHIKIDKNQAKFDCRNCEQIFEKGSDLDFNIKLKEFSHTYQHDDFYVDVYLTNEDEHLLIFSTLDMKISAVAITQFNGVILMYMTEQKEKQPQEKTYRL